MTPKDLVASWLDGRARPGPDLTVTLAPRRARGLADKLRRAYAWVTEQAIVCPYHDIAFGEPTHVGRDDARVELSRRSYASYALLPLLNLATSQRLLFVGAPGRGKTTMATLMARIAGIPLDDVRRLVQHGHPQLTISDLLGSPLPSELIRVEHGERIRVAWRKWIGERVKIIDEYNRIPTKTQSALLSLMAEGYAEAFEQVVHAGKSAWFFTANDDLGGGTFPVIEALKDRIDAVVRCVPFHSRHVGDLAARVADGRSPEAVVPDDIVFSSGELDQAEQEIRAVPVPEETLDVLGFFAGQLDFCRRASDTLELRTKDTLHLAGRKVAHVCTEDCPLDKQVHLCTQTENGVSARALQSILLFAKALAYFRGAPGVSVEDVHRVLPFVLHDKIRHNPQSAFFQKTENQVLLVDRITWIRRLFDGAVAQYAAYEPVRAEVRKLEAELGPGIGALPEGELKKRLGRVQQRLDAMLKKNELGGSVYGWSSYLLLSRPALGKSLSIAQIDLATRQITLDGETIVEKGLTNLVEALLAHEIGHHVRYPGSLAVSARMRIIEKNLVPIEGYSLMNLFTDLMINERLGHDLEDDLVRIYQSFDGERRWERDPAFIFYLAVYEELWQRERGELQGSAFEPFAKEYPDHRADAQLLAQDLFRLGPNVYTQFLYFASIMSRYIAPRIGEKPESVDPYACGGGEPSPDDWADALTPGAAEKEAIRRALEEGWFGEDQKERLGKLTDLERRIHSLPGSHTDDASRVPEVMAAYYRLEAERYLLRPPPVALVGEAVVPTTLDEWEMGDPVAAIDWLATLVERGDRVGAVQPLKRERIADVEGADVPLWQPRTEIYLDVSGSMPDPRESRNAMTLAAQILCVGTVRAGGWVRALLYSGDHVKYWTFCRSEVEMSRFLMHYIGGGTVFPFEVLAASVAEHGAGQPIRVVITDTDFDANLDADEENAAILALAASQSTRLVLLLHGPRPERVKRYRGMGALVIAVENLDDFPRMAADLSRALFQERVHEAP